MKKALAINISDIGDIVSSSIVVDSLIDQGYEVDFLMPKFVHSLYSENLKIKLVTEEQVTGLAYDLVVDLTSDKNSRRIVRLVKANAKLGRIKGTWQKIRHWITYSKMVPKKLDGHIVSDYYPLLHALNDQEKRIPKLSSTPSIPAKLALEANSKIVSIHFGAHNPKRVIPKELLSAAINSLHKDGYKIVLLGTEKEIGNDLVKTNNNIPIYQDLNLSEVKSVLSASKLFIGADSGILHIASALSCPSVGVYGPNVPRRSGPKNPCVSFFEQELDCRPCNQNVACPIAVKCMTTLDKNKFLELIYSKL